MCIYFYSMACNIYHFVQPPSPLIQAHSCTHTLQSSAIVGSTLLATIEQLAFDFDGIVIRSRFAMNAEFLSKTAKLKFIARSGAGMENIDIPFYPLH